MIESARGEEFRDDLRAMAGADEGAARPSCGVAPPAAPGAGVPMRRLRLLDAAEVQALTALDDRQSVAAVGWTVATVAALWAIGIGFWSQPWVVAGVVLLMASQQHALFVLAHDAAHYRLFGHRRVNDVIGRFVGTVGGVSMCTYRVTHRLHHNHLYGAQDPDVALHGGYPRGRAYLLRKLLVDLTGWTAPKTYAYFFGAPAVNAATGSAQRPLDDTAPALRDAARRDGIGVIAFQTLAPLAVLLLGGRQALAQYLVLWLLPMLTVLQALLRLRAVAEHGAPAGYDSALRAARTNLTPGFGGRLARLFLFPHHVNYHIEHHLYPAVPHYRLPRLHALLRERGLLTGAEVRDFRATLRRIFAPRGSLAEAM